MDLPENLSDLPDAFSEDRYLVPDSGEVEITMSDGSTKLIQGLTPGNTLNIPRTVKLLVTKDDPIYFEHKGALYKVAMTPDGPVKIPA